MWTGARLDVEGISRPRRSRSRFLQVHRADGKIPHEISQSASLVRWWEDYEFPWASADATPLYVIAQGDHWSATGNRAFLDASWESIVKAWRFSSETDRDGNGLIENTKVGHGWTEGSPPYPPHEEIYLQGVWIEASRAMAELADAKGDAALAATARAAAEKCRAAVEKTYWLKDAAYYAFATALAKPEKEYNAEPGPRRAARQARLDALRGKLLVDEDTVLPAVPLWWRTLDAERAQSQIAISRARPWPRTGGIGSSPPHRAVRPLASTSARDGAGYRLGVDGRVSLRPPPRRVPGGHGQRPAHRSVRARVRDRAPVR